MPWHHPVRHFRARGNPVLNQTVQPVIIPGPFGEQGKLSRVGRVRVMNCYRPRSGFAEPLAGLCTPGRPALRSCGGPPAEWRDRAKPVATRSVELPEHGL